MLTYKDFVLFFTGCIVAFPILTVFNYTAPIMQCSDFHIGTVIIYLANNETEVPTSAVEIINCRV
jgi:hypothetical protein